MEFIMSYNRIILVGNCTKDGELRYSQGGSGIYKNSIAVSRKFTVNGEKREEVCYVDFTAFARLSEICNQYLRKGSKILVEGRLNFDQWTDQNGQKRSKHSVTVESMQMLDSKADSSTQEPQTQQQQYQQPSQQQSASQTYLNPGDANQAARKPQEAIPEIDIDEEQIPF
jgi:single-strand DNA-binding protein